MKKSILFLLTVFVVISVNAQLTNLNPDPNGEPWWAGDLPEVTPAIQAHIDAIPFLVLSQASANTVLPDEVDNSDNIYMRPILMQYQGTCAQAAGIAYTYTYEINRLRNLSATVDENQYPTHYTYNFVNNGVDEGSWYYDAWDILQDNGCPNKSTYGGMYVPGLSYFERYKIWVSDYSLYHSGMYNRVKDYYQINATEQGGLELIKHWLNDHNEGEGNIGGLICFATYLDHTYPAQLPQQSSHAGDWIFTSIGWSQSSYHAMTIVGYDDNVKYDLDGNGVFSSDEIGAVKVANSYGTDWFPSNDGYIWIPYKFIPDDNKMQYFMVVNAEDYTPEIELKIEADYSKRSLLQFASAYGANANDNNLSGLSWNSMINDKGGELPMQGINNDPLEFMLDFGHFYKDEGFYQENEFGKIFLRVYEDDEGNHYNGTINAFSIVDYRWGEEFELGCEANFPVNIINNNYTDLFVNYDLIVPGDAQLITQNTDLTSDMVSRFSPTVTENKTLTVKNGVEIDMYNSELIIESGSSLVIENNATIYAKRGENKISIYGNIQIGSNVNFIADEGCTLELYLDGNPVSISSDNFTNCRVTGYANPLTITGSHFTNSSVEQSVNDVTISGSTFSNSTFVATNMLVGGPGLLINTATVNNCTFATTNPEQTAIYLFYYADYSFTNNIIHGYYNGIHVNQSGFGLPSTPNIMNNDISSCSMYGISIYNSTVSLAENHLFDNYRGLGTLNRSSVALVGNPNTNTYDEENVIENNKSYEVYASSGSFPWYFKYNAIIDDNNQGNQNGDPLVYYDGTASRLDVKYNCWGNSFDPSQDLFPQNTDAYLVDPTYCPGGKLKSSEITLEDFQQGLDYFENEQYADAKASFESIVELYPKTQYAEVSMKELFALEKFMDNDYSALQQYYESNDSIQADTVLTKLSVFLSNKCEIELQNWQTAIDHFESIIENPETPEDSIFAIIDLGYTYLLMGDSGYKSTAQGRLLEYKPTSQEAFSTKRDYLISLLPFGKSASTNETPIGMSKQGELLQNIPNPFTNTTSIQFNLNSSEFSSIEIRVLDQVGKEVRRIPVISAKEGSNTVELNMQGVPSGVYYYSLIVNGTQADTKKMVVAR